MNFEHIPKIYTDGSCLNNPGAGGWAFVLLEGSKMISKSGKQDNTTNNRMELKAIIEALSYSQGEEYVIYTDSQLTINCATGKWRRKANIDLWEEYDKALRSRNIHYIWVKGHNGNKYNEIVDDLARKEAKNCEK